MADVFGRITKFITALSVLLCLATFAQWVRSKIVEDRWVLPGKGLRPLAENEMTWSAVSISSYDGRIMIAKDIFWRRDACEPPRGVVYTCESPSAFWRAELEGRGHFGLSEAYAPQNIRPDWAASGPPNSAAHLYGVPLWQLMFLFAALPTTQFLVALMRFGRAQQRRAAGYCPNCGYDLRATPDRCPECGMSDEQMLWLTGKRRS
jgi:hypothetical protein